MKSLSASILSILLIVIINNVVNGQLIIDENDPTGKRIIHLLMDAINDYQHNKQHDNHQYQLKRLVYTFGESPKYSVELYVTDSSTSTQVSFN